MTNQTDGPLDLDELEQLCEGYDPDERVGNIEADVLKTLLAIARAAKEAEHLWRVSCPGPQFEAALDRLCRTLEGK